MNSTVRPIFNVFFFKYSIYESYEQYTRPTKQCSMSPKTRV